MPKSDILKSLRRLTKTPLARRALASSSLLAIMLVSGCGDKWSIYSSGHSHIYGVFLGPSADYTRGGAAGPVVDNGFSVDGVQRPMEQARVQQPSYEKHDSLSDNGKDGLIGKHSDTLLGSDPTSMDSGNNAVDGTADPLTSSGDTLDPDSKFAGKTDPGENYYSYWIRGNVDNATLIVKVNQAEVPQVQGHVDQDISDMVHNGINRVDFTYSAEDNSSSALISIRKGAPDLPDSVRFDSNVYALSAATASPGSPPPTVTKTVYFLAD